MPSLAEKKEYTVDTPTIAHISMSSKWDLITALLSDSDGMRAQKTIYLPQEEGEKAPMYESRVARSFLYAGYKDGVNHLVSRPFVRPASFYGELPPKLLPMETNIDREGGDLSQFAKDVLADGVHRGLTHILVGYPVTGDLSPYEQNKKEMEGDIYPYFIHVKAENVIGERHVTLSNGQKFLTMVRIYERHVIDEGKWGEREVEFIRVLYPDKYELYKKEPNEEEFSFDKEVYHTFKAIPLHTFYTNKTGFMMGEPALYPLAETNLTHWQSYSDQRNILKFIRVGILFGSGMKKTDMENMVIGPSQIFIHKSPEANLRYVEHTGQAVEAGERDVQALEAKMLLQGLQPMMTKPGSPTATGEAIAESKSQSDLQSWIRDEETVLTDAYRTAGKWAGEEIDEDFQVNIFNDFTISLHRAQDLEYVFKLAQSRLLPLDMFYELLIQHGVLPENTDVKALIKKLNEEGIEGEEPQAPPAGKKEEDEPAEGEEEE